MSGSGESTRYIETSDGFLTETDRKYLLGEKTYDNVQSERNRRQDIRNRILATLFDFNLLANHLDERDRELVFRRLTDESTDKRPRVLSAGPEEQRRIRRMEFGGLVETIAFLFAGLKNTDVPQSTVIERAVTRAELRELPASLDVKAVDLDREFMPTLDLDRIVEKLTGREPLTDEERQDLCSICNTDTPRFVNHLLAVPLDVDTVLQREEPLSPDESLVLVAYVFAYPERFQETDVAFEELLADEVRDRVDFEYRHPTKKFG